MSPFITPAHAQAILKPIGNSNTVSSGNFAEILVNIGNSVVNILLLITGILAVLYIMYAGFQMITSAGNADKIKVARAGIINGIIGVVVVIAAILIVQLSVTVGRIITDSDGRTSTTLEVPIRPDSTGSEPIGTASDIGASAGLTTTGGSSTGTSSNGIDCARGGAGYCFNAATSKYCAESGTDTANCLTRYQLNMLLACRATGGTALQCKEEIYARIVDSNICFAETSHCTNGTTKDASGNLKFCAAFGADTRNCATKSQLISLVRCIDTYADVNGSYSDADYKACQKLVFGNTVF